MKRSATIDFLAKAQKNQKLGARILAAVERGGKTTAEEVLEIAREFGFSLTRAQFEREARQDLERRFAAGEDDLAAALGKKIKPKPKPPQSSCAKGCLSWTVNWHPPVVTTTSNRKK
jgi:Nif11 domain